MIILGGNISLSFNYFYTSFEKTLADRHVKIEIGISRLGENAALIGAASSHYLSATVSK